MYSSQSLEDLARALGARERGMIRDELMQPFGVEARHVAHHVDAAMRVEIAALVIARCITSSSSSTGSSSTIGEIAALGEIAVLVEHIGDAARHAGREIAAGVADDDDDAARHIFAAVIAGALDDRDRAGVAHRETLAGDAAEIAFAGDRAIERRVADDDRFPRRDARSSAAGG